MISIHISDTAWGSYDEQHGATMTDNVLWRQWHTFHISCPFEGESTSD